MKGIEMLDGLDTSSTRAARHPLLALTLGLCCASGFERPAHAQTPPPPPPPGRSPFVWGDGPPPVAGGTVVSRPGLRVAVAKPDAPTGPLVLEGLIPVDGQDPIPQSVPGRAPVQAPPPPPPEPGRVPGPGGPAAAPAPSAGPSALPESPDGPPIAVSPAGRVSIHVNDVDIRQVLELFSRETGVNLLVSPGVQGVITVNLDRLTSDQALEAILRLGNLSAKREQGLVYILSPAEVAQQGSRGDIVTRVYRLDYVQASDVDTMIRPFLSEAGKMTVSPRAEFGIGGGGFAGFGGVGGAGGGGGGGATGGNSLAGGDLVVIQDFEANIRTIDQIIRRIDVQPVQVLVEAVLLSVELDRSINLGINFAILQNAAGTGLAVFGNGAALSANAGFDPARTINNLGKFRGGGTYGFPSDINGAKYGFINKRTTAFIDALETIGEVNILASPRVLVLNKQRAEIQLGQRLGYFTASQNLTSTVQTVQFLNTGTLLRFRPFVSADGMIRMEVHPEKSSGQVVNNVPNSNTSEVTTNVMVPDGATIVIGGLIENNDATSHTGTLGLSRLPVVGPLFRQKDQNSTKRELIVMLTPRIWNPAMVNAGGAAGPLLESTSPPVEIPLGSTGRAGSNGNRALDAGKPAPPASAAATTARPAPLTERAPSAALREAASPSTHPARRPASIRRVVDETPRRDDAVVTAGAEAVAPAKHVVRSGENFWTIARTHYGSGRYYMALWAANRRAVARPEGLAVGTTIDVPPVGRLDPSLVVAPVRNVPDPAARRDDQIRRAAGEPEPGPEPTPPRPRGNWRPARSLTSPPPPEIPAPETR